jgi:hypothetical protein
MKMYIPFIVILLLIISCAEKHKTYKKEVSNGKRLLTFGGLGQGPGEFIGTGFFG